jgi:hypothetical protein
LYRAWHTPVLAARLSRLPKGSDAAAGREAQLAKIVRYKPSAVVRHKFGRTPVSDTDSGHSQELIVDVADRLFTAIEQSDVAMLNQIFGDNIAVWRVGARRDNDKQKALKVLHWLINVTTERRYEILDRQLFPNGFVQQHILHAIGHNGGSIALRVCIVIKLGIDGLINRIDEYFDPAELAPLLS